MDLYFDFIKNTVIFYGILAQIWYIFKCTKCFRKLRVKSRNKNFSRAPIETVALVVAIASFELYKKFKIFPLVFIFYFLRGTFEAVQSLSSEFKARHLKEIAVVISIISLISSAILLK